MDVDQPTEQQSGQPLVSRDKTAPFLIRVFAKIGGFHRLTLFEDGTLPTTDEHQIFTWRDATLREVLTTLRATSPHVAEFKHPLARFSFRTIYADSTLKGRFASKDLGMVYSRDILGEPGSLNSTAPRLLLDDELHPARTAPTNADGDSAAQHLSAREKEERTLEELRFVPGDYLSVSAVLPKGAQAATELSIKGSGANAAGPVNPGWKTGAAGDRLGALGSGPPRGAGGHWRGGSEPAGRGGRGGGFTGRGVDRDAMRDRDLDRDRDRDLDRRVPPPRRRDFSPPRGGGGWGARGGGARGRDDRRSRSRSRSRSPPRRRRYD